VFSGGGLCIGLITRQEESTECGVPVTAKPHQGKPWLGIGSKNYRKK